MHSHDDRLPHDFGQKSSPSRRTQGLIFSFFVFAIWFEAIKIFPIIKELAVNENSTSFLTPEYQEILENAERYKLEYKRSPSHLERLYGMITDLYIDKFKFIGINVKNKVPLLIEKLDNYDPEELIKFFQSS
jgi:Bardet-Biedl syndrome 7 protein